MSLIMVMPQLTNFPRMTVAQPYECFHSRLQLAWRYSQDPYTYESLHPGVFEIATEIP